MQAQVVIIGAGPAGIATAIAARQRGLTTIVVDARTPPIDKTCGEGLLPLGVTALRALGIYLNSNIAIPFTGIRFTDEDTSACAEFDGTTGFAVRRVLLHELLVERANTVGVIFLWGAPVSEFGRQHILAGGNQISYRWLVGADGQNSRVRKWAELDSGMAKPRRFGFRRHFRIRPWSQLVEVYWRLGCQMVVTPTGAEEVGVAVFSHDPRFRLDQALPLFPALAEKLRGSEYASAESGDATSLRQYPKVTQGPVALVGDASGSVDALAGHGLSLSFQQASHLAHAFESGDLSRYESAHRKIAMLPAIMTRLLLSMDKVAGFRRFTLRTFKRSPALFSKLLSIHTNNFPFGSLVHTKIDTFGRSALRT